MDETDFLNKEIKRYLKALQDLKIDEKPKTIQINSIFISKNKDKPTEVSEESLKAKAELLIHKNNPVLYWFSFDNYLDEGCEILKEYELEANKSFSKEYKKGKEHYFDNNLIYRRAFSACKSGHNLKTKTLYVGKVQKDIWGRLSVHTGWGTSPKTAGMQLRFWYDFKKYGNLTFNYIVLHNDLKYFVEVLEKELRQKLNPLLGKK